MEWRGEVRLSRSAGTHEGELDSAHAVANAVPRPSPEGARKYSSRSPIHTISRHHFGQSVECGSVDSDGVRVTGGIRMGLG